MDDKIRAYVLNQSDWVMDPNPLKDHNCDLKFYVLIYDLLVQQKNHALEAISSYEAIIAFLDKRIAHEFNELK